MVLLLEIILTVTSWRKGWRARALLPLGVTMTVGFVVGAVIAATGGSAPALHPLYLLADVPCLGALAFLTSRAPGSSEAQVSTHADGLPDVSHAA